MSNQEVEVIEDAEIVGPDEDLFGPEREAALVRLREDERIIESGLSTFIDVGRALERIRDGKAYKALPENYSTFEDYCLRRWDISREHGRRLIEANNVAAALPPMGGISPMRERQIRELMPLKDDPDNLQAAWAGAVELANGGQPTAAQVREVVNQYRQDAEPGPDGVGERKHPAPFSTAILRVIRELLGERTKVLDPFAGTGRIHLLTEYGFDTYGVEIEKEWAELNERTLVGSALKLPGKFRKGSFDAIATSPTYGNRLADSYDASDPDRRHSYHFDLGRVPSAESSAVMPWGDEYRAFHERAWREAVRVLKPNGRFILNIKDHIRDGEWQDVSAWHAQTIIGLGFRLVAIRPVGTRGRPSGDNADVRSDAELVLAFDRIEDNG